MRRIKNKWDDLAINRKIFVITTSLSLGLVITMYLILYFLLPTFYTSHKIKSLEDINTLEPSEVFAFTGKMSDFTGVSSTQPPTWIRPHTLVDCGYKGVIHVVGHTNVGPLSNYKDAYVKSGIYSQVELDRLVDVWCCDALPREYLIIENDKFIVKKWD